MKLCVALTGRTAEECIMQIRQTDADMLEHRIDLMTEVDHLERVYSECTRPTVATNRPPMPWERRPVDETRRIRLLIDAIHAGASYVDIELDSPRLSLNRLRDAARERDCRIILSQHFYDCSPSLTELLSVWTRMREQGADISKIVTMPRTHQEATRVLSLYSHNQRKAKCLVAFGMGSAGKFTRVAALYMGAPFMYVAQSRGQEVAPGQLTVSTMRGIMEALA